ncbi:MAG: NUDIX hydrolase [Acidimicrobiales bacterium]
MTPPERRPPRFEGHRYPQIIPDPDEIEMGLPAPWSVVSHRANLTLELVARRLAESHHLLNAELARERPEEFGLVADAAPTTIAHRSAVLVALFEESGESHVVLTRRSYDMRSHRGEIAFPGGRSHGGETPTETALREAHEEVGLDPTTVTPFAWLSPIATFASSSAIFPIVGLLPGRPELVIEPSEVDRAFSVALSDLVADEAFLEERWRHSLLRVGADEGGFFPIYFFKVPDDVIWGATARVLTELLSLVTGAPWPTHRDGQEQSRQ